MSQAVKVWLDKNFLQAKGAGEILTNLEKLNVHTIIEDLPVKASIFWTRSDTNIGKDKQLNEVQHDHILVRLETDQFLEYVNDFLNSESTTTNALVSFVQNIKDKAQVTQITLLIQNFKQFLKSVSNKTLKNLDKPDLVKKKTKSKAAARPNLTKSEINSGVIHLELMENCSVRSYETSEELKELILSYTKSVSEYADKHEKAENIIFCDSKGDSKSKIGKDGQGLLNLWKDILECFPLVSCDQAQAICASYPSPFLLYEAYKKCSKPEMLLADIQVRRGAGVLSSVRRIGPELSKKVHKFFTTENCELLLVNE